MGKAYPSLAALLALVAVAGYQNRDKIADFVNGMKGKSEAGGLGELVDRFRKAGHGEAADSWVRTGENKPVETSQIESSLGSDLIDGLVKQTGIARDELLSRLKRVLPETVDKMTPDGRLPS